MEKRSKIWLVLLACIILSALLCGSAFAQLPQVKIQVSQIGNVFSGVIKWYEATETTQTVNGQTKIVYKMSDQYKTQRMIVDITLFFMIFAGMIYFALHKWIGEKSKGALIVLTVGLAFGMALALVTQTKYGSITIFFPFARNLITIAFAILLFFLLNKIIDSKFWAAVAAIILTWLAFGGLAILMCSPGQQCNMFSWFKQGVDDSVVPFTNCDEMFTKIQTGLDDATTLIGKMGNAAAESQIDTAKQLYNQAKAKLDEVDGWIKTATDKNCNATKVAELKAKLDDKRSELNRLAILYKLIIVTPTDECKSWAARTGKNAADWECLSGYTCPAGSSQPGLCTGNAVCIEKAKCSQGPGPGPSTDNCKDWARSNGKNPDEWACLAGYNCPDTAKKSGLCGAGAEVCIKKGDCTKITGGGGRDCSNEQGADQCALAAGMWTMGGSDTWKTNNCARLCDCLCSSLSAFMTEDDCKTLKSQCKT